MSEVVKKPLKITETVLRDAHQSLIATRMTTEQMLPIVDKMDKVGYNAVECWGGATFDACLRFLKEDPWDRLRKLRDGFKNTKLQMLFRGQNILGYRPYADDVAKVVVEEGVKVVTTGAGNPAKYMKMWKEAGIIVIPVVASVALAKLMERGGADAVVAEGTESGGHIGEATTMTLVPQVVDAVSIPVIAAGGIGDGRGIAAAFMLGAEAVQMGTRFVVADECTVHENYKQRIIKAKDIDSTVTGRSHGHPVRGLRNQMTREYIKLEQEGKSFEELEYLTLGKLREAVQEGDVMNGTVMAGQIAGMISKKQSCKEMIEEMMEQASGLMHWN